MTPILVTGGCGFIGSHLVRHLLAEGCAVRVFDNLSSGYPEMLGEALPHVELLVGDLRDAEALRRATRGVAIVFHLAALVSVVQTVEQPLRAYAVNATGTLELLEAARAAGVGRLVQASTCAVYGDSERLPAAEDDPPRPLSPYASSKLAAEYAGQVYSRLYGLEAISLRFFNVYGPRQSPSSPYAAVVPRFIQAYLEGGQPTIYGDGGQTRDFVFVGDVVAALWAAARAEAVAGEVLNVGRGEGWSVLDLARVIGELLQLAVAPRFAPTREGEVRHSRADTQRLERVLGFRPPTSLRDGLAATVAAFQHGQRGRPWQH
jgi:nucleoside-diphosphate-sugar epimerase